MSGFVLGVVVTMGLIEQTTYFEARILKGSYQQCIEDAKTYKLPLQEIDTVIPIETYCEKVLVESDQRNKGTSV